MFCLYRCRLAVSSRDSDSASDPTSQSIGPIRKAHGDSVTTQRAPVCDRGRVLGTHWRSSLLLWCGLLFQENTETEGFDERRSPGPGTRQCI